MIDPLELKFIVMLNRVQQSDNKVCEIRNLLHKAIQIHAENYREFNEVVKEMEVEKLCKEIQESTK